MLHGVSAPWLHKGGDRYRYGYRYSDWHVDLLDVLSDYGAIRSVKLDEVSRLFSFPGKFGIDGSEVKSYFDDGRLKEIRDYCETDVMNTWLVYLRYALHREDTTTDGYNKAVADLITYIDTHKDERPHLREFLEAWGEACGNRFLMK